MHNPGCRCRECETLATYMQRLTGKDYGLPTPTAPPALRVIPRECPMVCDCTKCRREKTRERPVARQPWETRPARRAA